MQYRDIPPRSFVGGPWSQLFPTDPGTPSFPTGLSLPDNRLAIGDATTTSAPSEPFIPVANKQQGTSKTAIAVLAIGVGAALLWMNR